MRVIEFNIAIINGVDKARGNPLWLMIGGRRVKFVLQHGSDGKATWLTHYASGQRFGTLDNAATELMCKFSPYHRFTKKQLAEFLLDKMITRFGVDFVLDKLDAVPVINQDRKPLDAQCKQGLHSWIDEVGKLPADTKCTRCGEPYGDVK